MPEPSTCQYCGGDQDRRGVCARCDAAASEAGAGESKGWKRALIIAAGLLGLAVASAAIVAE
ncbi:MAG: hypothetical protein JNJ73_08600 [Hyphomonadaceae bacterium]|nr:hypothetical protein [Hyphomonadaceae bacterium]